MNPFSQGWAHSSQLNANHAPQGAVPSVYGALPYTPRPLGAPTFLKFTFASPDGTVLNGRVVGPGASQSQATYFAIATDSTTSGVSVVQNPQRATVARIEWRTQAVVEIHDAVSRQRAAQWLVLSADKTYRIMSVRGHSFTWMPQDDYIGLYTRTPRPQLLGRVSQGQDGAVLEVAAEVVQMGLLEALVVAALLLMCGRNID
ncbi:hypothetical protein B0H10DRAFT_1046219 [Mycena sp. CBHHK59/15]|nr:hypothetical protein B0H10DRAFT_1046219 [Mycena sp. CBHHK59/15]